MTTPKDWRARVRTKLITPPGSIPSIEEDRPVIQPPKLNYPPLGPIAGGSPGKGPGFALTDHQHPPQPISNNGTSVSVEHNGILVGTEPALDFADDTNPAGIVWTVTDVPGSNVAVSGRVTTPSPQSFNLTTSGAVGAGATFQFFSPPLIFDDFCFLSLILQVTMLGGAGPYAFTVTVGGFSVTLTDQVQDLEFAASGIYTSKISYMDLLASLTASITNSSSVDISASGVIEVVPLFP